MSESDIAYCRLALALVTAARLGRTEFERAFVGLLSEIAADQSHPLHGVEDGRWLLFAMALIATELGDLLQQALPDDPCIFDAVLSRYGREIATWPVARVGR